MGQEGERRESWITSIILVLPLLIGYVAGLILLGPDVANGADVINPLVRRHFGTGGLMWFNVALIFLFLWLISYFRRRDRFDPKKFLPTVLESAFYALTMGAVIIFLMRQATLISIAEAERLSPMHGIVISLGAGVNEELFFRVVLMGALAAFGEELGLKKGWAMAMAIIVSSIAFSLAHYFGTEPFDEITFIYRFLAGIIFALLYRFRSFAIAVYTHTLYDIMVLVLRPG